MKRTLIVMLAGLVLAGSVFGGVVRKTKSEITFQKFGTLTTTQEEKLTSELKSSDMESAFKGKGLVSNLAGKALLRSGVFGEIVNLPQATVTNIDHKRKQYKVTPLEPVNTQAGRGESGGKTAGEEKPGEKDVKIVRSEFKVEKTNESKVINQFACNKYQITWVTDWENTKTGEKGTERLATDVWATALTSDLRAGMQVHSAFYKEYMKKIGLETEAEANDYLGLSWMRILAGMDPTGSRPQINMAKAAAELKKIQGFPVVVDGKYFSKSEGGTKDEEQEEGGGLLGKLGKKLLKKDKPEDADAPLLAYYTELLEIRTADLGPADFEPPAGYKEKK